MYFEHKNVGRIQKHLRRFVGIPDSTLSSIIYDLVANSRKNNDTTHWQQEEIKKSFLINNEDESLNFKNIVKQLGISDDSTKQQVRKKVKKWNYQEPQKRERFALSKPVFSQNKDFAIIKQSHYCGNLCGRTSINLYVFANSKWNKVTWLLQKVS